MAKRVAFFIAVIAVLAGTAVGCERNSSSEPAEGNGGEGAAEAPLVDYRVTGGFAGVDVRLVIFEDGTAEATSNRNPTERSRRGERRLEGIRQLLAAGKWDEPISVDENVSVADGFQYVIVYQGKRVTVSDPNVPVWMTEITTAMSAIAMSAG